MKTINKLFLGLGLISLSSLYSCSDFDEVNTDPSKTPITSVKPQYALNQSIGKSLMDPSTGERVVVYNWGDAARLVAEKKHLSIGDYDDDFMSSFYYPCISDALTAARLAIEVVDNPDTPYLGNEAEFYPNVKQFARIWRAYLISQFTDSFGPYALNAGEGNNPAFNSVEETYDYMLAELKDAVSNINTSVTPTEAQAKCDPFFEYNASKWVKYGNSLRMRLAMRLTNVNSAKAREEFEDAAKGGNYIATLGDIQSVVQTDGWNDYAGPYSRTYNQHCLSSTMSNILTNLGGIPVEQQRPDLSAYVKPANYLGVKYEKHFVPNTDSPTKQMWMDGIPANLDPRGLRLFYMPGDSLADNKVTNRGATDKIGTFGLINKDNIKDTIKINAKRCWNGMPVGTVTSWSPATITYNQLWSNATARISNFPMLSDPAANAKEKQVFFGPWESYFLLAEAALYGWNTGMTAQAAYEQGVKSSFEYFGVSQYADAYLNSEAYNRVGTSVKFTHTAEPTSMQMNYVDGYTKESKTTTYEYPTASKTFYGKALNDQLTKIITQKYIAQMPYLVLECWSDYRRLGLPFFDMPANESTMTGTDMEKYWTPESYKSGQKWQYFPQRMRYPTSLKNADPVNYGHALELLGGDDTTMSPLWWSKH